MFLKERWTCDKLECVLLADDVCNVRLTLTHAVASYSAPRCSRNARKDCDALKDLLNLFMIIVGSESEKEPQIYIYGLCIVMVNAT